MDVKSVLEYQEIDLELRKIELEIERSEDYKTARKARADFEAARDMANQCEKKAGEIISLCSKIEDYYNKNHTKIDDAAKKLEDMVRAGVDVDDLYELSDELEKLADKFDKGVKGLSDALKKISEVDKAYKENTKSAVINKKLYATSRTNFEGLKAEKAPQMTELKAKLEGMEKGVDTKLLEKYKSLRKDKILPAFVPLEGKRCAGCRMELSSSQLTGFKDGLIECESCRRIIYK